MNNLKLSELINVAKETLYTLGFSEATVERKYGYIWNRLLGDVGDVINLEYDIVHKHALSYYRKDILESELYTLKMKERTIRYVLLELLYFKENASFHHHPLGQSIELSSLSSLALTSFLSSSYNKQLKPVTLETKATRISTFLRNNPLEDLNEQRVLTYIASLKERNKYAARLDMNKVKHFLKYAYEENIITTNYQPLFPTHVVSSVSSISSYYSKEEIRQVIEYVKTANSKMPKRDYAIVLLLALYGLRANDVAHMSLDTINWDSNLLTIVTSKTNVQIVHSLLPIVGNAIIDYLLNERVKTHTRYLFLKYDGSKMKTKNITCLSNKAFYDTGIDTRNKHCGAHSFRSSLATRMLEQNISIYTISKVLSHASIDTTKIYTKVDITHLSLCQLEVPTYE